MEISTAVLPVDANEVAGKIIELIYKDIEKFTDVYAINAVIEKIIESVTQQAKQLQQTSSDEGYTAVINDFLSKAVNEINSEFSHINLQIELKKANGGIDRKLTPEICSKIAAFKIKGRRFITTVEGTLDENQALFQLLTSGPSPTPAIKIRIEDWLNQDVHYLLYKLSTIVTQKLSIADIHRKRMLYLKKQTLFDRNTYDKFKSSTLEGYQASNPNAKIIDAFLTSLF